MAAKLASAMLAGLLSSPVQPAQLTLQDGVVVKFGSDAQLVVRDKLVPGTGLVFTSQQDDSAAGQTNVQPGTPSAGSWRGVRLEKSAAAYGTLSLSDVIVRYGGGAGQAGLAIRGWSPRLQYLQISDAPVGLFLSAGASPVVTGSSFLRNTLGVDIADGGAPSFGSTQFAGNANQGLLNRTPATTIQATGNWWGDASGPKDVVGNPAGKGDAVSGGVNYSGYLAQAPLINPTVRLSAPASYYEQTTVMLDLACINATEYRVVEGSGFSGVNFVPLTNGRISIPFTVSAGDGRKPISAQFRNANAAPVTATLAGGGVLIDTLPPSVAIVTPAAGSVVSGAITVEASASDTAGIAKLEFLLDGQLVQTRTSTPYTYNWNTDASAEGEHTLKVVATDAVGRVAEQSRNVMLTRVAPTPDLEGPVLSNLKLGGAALSNGLVVSKDSTLTLDASDRSGVARIELVVDDQVVGTATGSGSYSAVLSIAALTDGAHVLTLRASDSLGNLSSPSFNVTVAHAAPDVPKLSSPANGTVTRSSSIGVAGTAMAGTNVRVWLNGAVVGAPLTVAEDGRFSTALVLAPGLNQIQADSANAWGISARSSAVQVTWDNTVPASPSGLQASAQPLGKIHLSWSAASDAHVTGYNVYRAAAPFTEVGEAGKSS